MSRTGTGTVAPGSIGVGESFSVVVSAPCETPITGGTLTSNGAENSEVFPAASVVVATRRSAAEGATAGVKVAVTTVCAWAAL